MRDSALPMNRGPVERSRARSRGSWTVKKRGVVNRDRMRNRTRGGSGTMCGCGWPSGRRESGVIEVDSETVSDCDCDPDTDADADTDAVDVRPTPGLTPQLSILRPIAIVTPIPIPIPMPWRCLRQGSYRARFSVRRVRRVRPVRQFGPPASRGFARSDALGSRAACGPEARPPVEASRRGRSFTPREACSTRSRLSTPRQPPPLSSSSAAFGRGSCFCGFAQKHCLSLFRSYEKARILRKGAKRPPRRMRKAALRPQRRI